MTLPLRHCIYGPRKRIRTFDLLVPNQALYQTKLRAENVELFGGVGGNRTHHTVLAKHRRPLGTCDPKFSRLTDLSSCASIFDQNLTRYY